MLPYFVIGLREGLEAALIVGIIAAFLAKQNRRDLLRPMLAGVAVAALICLCVGVGLRIYTQDLPQRQQEGLETVIGALAVVMVTYMVVWMKRHSRGFKAQLEGLVADAIGSAGRRAGLAMVGMAFLAVLREGLETVVFLLAALDLHQSKRSPAVLGAVLGIGVAVVLGYGIYRGGVQLNLSKFFRATGLVLVFVAAGLVVNALGTAHEAGWLNVGQGSTVDLSWLVQPNTVRWSLLTGMLGIQPRPVTIEVLAWFVYLIPVGLYVAWPPGRRVAARVVAFGCAGLAALCAAGAVIAYLGAPAALAARPTTRSAGFAAQVVSRSGGTLVVDLRSGSSSTTRTLRPAGARTVGDVAARVFRARTVTAGAPGQPGTLTVAQVAQRNGGRLPLGLRVAGSAPLRAVYTTTSIVEVAIAGPAQRVVDATRSTQVLAQVGNAGGSLFALDAPVSRTVTRLSTPAIATASREAATDSSRAEQRAGWQLVGTWGLVVSLLAALGALSAALLARRRDVEPESVPTPNAQRQRLPLAASIR